MIAEDNIQLPVETGTRADHRWRCWFVLPEEGLLRPIFHARDAVEAASDTRAICPRRARGARRPCKCGVWVVCAPLMLREPEWVTAPPPGIDPIPASSWSGKSLVGRHHRARAWLAGSVSPIPAHLSLFATMTSSRRSFESNTRYGRLARKPPSSASSCRGPKRRRH